MLFLYISKKSILLVNNEHEIIFSNMQFKKMFKNIPLKEILAMQNVWRKGENEQIYKEHFETNKA